MKNVISKLKRQRGFTLLEVMAVVGVIAIITVLAIPATRQVEKAVYETGCVKGLKVIYEACELYYREMGMYPVHTETDSRLFFREIDRFLPEPYYIRHAENHFIRGYRLFAYAYPPSGSGSGGGSGGPSGPTSNVTRYGSHTFFIKALPIHQGLGLSTFYLGPGGVVTKDDEFTPY